VGWGGGGAHLGTPLVATDAAGAELWTGPFEPFGRDPWAGTSSAASAEDVFLRFPGQWDDEVWLESTMGAEVYYNVHRWYQPGMGRYTKPDPLGLAGGMASYGYADLNPLVKIDPTGEQWREGHIPSPEEIEEMIERSCARQAFYRNYRAMREANWKKSDHYFHCKANCEATRCGGRGPEVACEMSDLREAFDELFKEDPPSSAAADQAANLFGRQIAQQQPNMTCQILCSQYRPRGLPRQY
jgi:RHS repeat-associated protein